MDHDQTFKNLFLDYPVAALELFAGEEGGLALRKARIVPLREEQLKERLGDRFRELDVPLLLEWPDGQREAVLFVLEEDTEPKNFSIHRLAHYCLDLSELLKTDRVVPVVVFLRRGTFQRELHLGGDRNVYLSFRFIHCELARLPAENYVDSDNIVARLNLPNMSFGPERRVEMYARAMEGLMSLEEDWNKQRKYAEFIDAYANLNDDEMARYRAEYAATEGVHTMGLLAKIHEEGLQEGEGRLLRRQLTRRFGELPLWVEARLAEAKPEQLEHWGERILDASTLESVFVDESHHGAIGKDT
jgi:hypothetical protein